MPGFDLTARKGDVPLGRRRVDEEERQRVSSEEYLATHNLELYLREAVKHASRCAAVRDPGGVNPNTHIEAAAEYFQAVNLGRHVAGREWAFVQATERNQLAFLHDCRRAWGSTPTTMSARDWHGALRLQCPDLPFAVVKAAHDAAVGAGEADEGEGEGEAAGDAAVDFRRLFPALRAAAWYASFLEDARAAAFEHSDLTPQDAGACRSAVRAAAARVRETLGDGCSPPEESLVDALDTAVRGGGGAVTFGKFRAALCAHEGLARVTAARLREHESRVRRASAAERAREYRDP